MLDYYFSNQFKKDLKLSQKRRCNMSVIYDVIIDIIFEDPLPDHCRPHRLSGNLVKYTECHAMNDVLLLYEADEEKVVFFRLGTHSDLF
ncbi:MAG TPA: type II toxin-antitoxin system mRNA interferase toxin, RelE/StbE family [Treponema sp.]|nr:type II toxin-antitoxin system mRNA interferase toxin, RelE/StbE family [Treponema sp.]